MATREELVAALLAHKEELERVVGVLATPVREPGVQVQFGKRAGDHTSDAVMQMERIVAAEGLSQLSADILRAVEKLSEGTYGLCDLCGSEIPEERLEALPWATLCVTCKQVGPPKPRP